MQSTAELLSTLEDTQAALATALARIEAYRIREQHLVEENLKLKEQLKITTGVGTVNSSSLSNTQSSVQNRDRINYRLQEEYPIVLHSKKGKVTGSLSARPEYLEIFESKARVTAGQCIGITKLTDKSNQPRIGLSESPKLNSKSWSWALFNKSKTAEDVTKQSKSTTPTTAALKRSSWSGRTRMSDSQSSANTRNVENEQNSIWRVLWKEGGGSTKIKQIVFEATSAAEAFITRQIKSWSNAVSQASSNDNLNQASITETQNHTSIRDKSHTSLTDKSHISVIEKTPSFAAAGQIVPAKHLIPDGPYSGLSVPSGLLDEEQVRCVTSGVPPRHRHAMWNLLYSTERHGMSLQTLLRKAQGSSPTVLVIKDSSHFVFGCYCSEAWKISQRFYGTGETFVFQMEPYRVYYPWKQESKIANNFFMFATNDHLGVGGTGHFAIWLDAELLYGRSGICDTFGSPCIASTEDFKVTKLELWSLA
eukprot:g547.t1